MKPLIARLESGGVKFTTSMSGRPAVFFRDPGVCVCVCVFVCVCLCAWVGVGVGVGVSGPVTASSAASKQVHCTAFVCF